MSKIDMNNPILFLPASSLEDREFKMQWKMNKLININLNKISKDILNQNIIDLSSKKNQIIIRQFTDKELIEFENAWNNFGLYNQ